MIDFTRIPDDLARRYRQEGYWRGEVLGSLLQPWSGTEPGREAIVQPGRGRWTYGQLDELANRFARGLGALGIGPGDRVVIQLGNVMELPVLSIALFRIGAVPVYALAAHRRHEITYLCDSAQAVAFITHDVHGGFDHRALAREVLGTSPSLRHAIIHGEAGELVSTADLAGSDPRAPGGAPAVRVDPESVAFFLLSGGTTGMPKLIPRTHDDYAYQLRATAAALGFGEDGVYLAALPVAHNAALGCPGVFGALRVGGKAVLLANPNPDVALTIARAEAVTLTTLMPPVVRIWVDFAGFEDVSLPRMTLQVGSARFPPELGRAAREALGCRLTQWFGMSEGLLTYTRLDDAPDVIDSTQGRPLCPADEIRVVDEHGHDVERGQVGELYTRGPYTIRGYYQAAEHNARAFTEDGFLRTGDLVRIDRDGNMTVEGRVKDVINRGGEKVSAGEVEDLIARHPGIREASVVAIPDELFGERVAAFVIAGERPPTLADLRAFLRGQGLADFKLPDVLERVASFPYTKVGKVDKSKMRDALVNGTT